MEYIETRETCRFASRLNQLPLQLKRDIALVTLQDGWNNIKRRAEMLNILGDYKIPFTDVGTGTNRFIFKYDGWVFKTALDDEGINDNKQEWNIGFTLPRLNPKYPDNSLPYEITKGGHLLVADYVPAFTSFNEMTNYKTEIISILKNWSDNGYLLGDVGYTEKNYANWGVKNGHAKCIDYAYIFRVSGIIFKCHKCGSMELSPDSYYHTYRCNRCKTEIPDSTIRARINSNIRSSLFKNSIDPAYTLEMTGTTQAERECTIKKPVTYNPDAPDRMEGFVNALNMIKNR